MVRPIIRTSDRGTFKKCREQWNFSSKLRMNLESNKEARALAFGTAIHAGLEVYYKPETWHLDTEMKVQLAKSAFLACWDKQKPDDETTEWAEDAELGWDMLDNYATEYEFEWKHFTPVKVEIEFEVPITVPDEANHPGSIFAIAGDALVVQPTHYDTPAPVMYQGRIDAIWQDTDGKMWLVDHKTAKKFDSTDWLALDEQCGSYMWAIQQMLGIKISGVIYNELRKDAPHLPKLLKNGSLSKDKNQNTTGVIYRKAIADYGLDPLQYAEILEHLDAQGNKFFRRTIVMRSQRELEIQGERIYYEAIDMLDNPTIYPSPNKFTCSFCDFFSACVSKQEGSDYDYILKDRFHVRETT